MNKRLSFGVLLFVLLTTALSGVGITKTLYVNVQSGADGYDGTSPTFQGGITGPKRTIDDAINDAVAGDIISVDFANGNAYADVAPPIDKDLTFTSTGGTPLILNWTVGAQHTFTGPFEIQNRLTMTTGGIIGGGNLTLSDGATIERQDNSCTIDATPVFAGVCDFEYTTDTAITTGNEVPAATDVIRNMTSSVNLTLASGPTVNGVFNSSGGAFQTDLNGYTMTFTNLTAAHQVGGDVSNGVFAFDLMNSTGAPTQTDLGGGADLPAITATNSGASTATVRLRTDQTIGTITNTSDNMVVEVYPFNNGTWVFPTSIAGLRNQAGGDIAIGNGTNDDDVAIENDVVSLGSGLILFDNGPASNVTIGGNFQVNDGTVEFTQAPLVTIEGNTQFFDGVVDVGTTGVVDLQGTSNTFGLSNKTTTFLPNPSTTVLEFGGNVAQTLTCDLTETVWPGDMLVDNTLASSAKGTPALTINDGTSGGLFRVLGDVTFQTGWVYVSSAQLNIEGDFNNVSGFDGNTTTSSYISMNGSTNQTVTGAGEFGNFDISCTGNVAATLVNAPAPGITITQYLYLSRGRLDGTIDFNAAPPMKPTIVRNEGTILTSATLTFTSAVNVFYIGNTGVERVAGPELPLAPDKLWDLRVLTVNGSIPGRGIVSIDGAVSPIVTVNGTLEVGTDQFLLLKGDTHLILNSGNATLNGDIVNTTDQDKLILASETGTILNCNGKTLPDIVVDDNSQGNEILGCARLKTGLVPGNPPSGGVPATIFFEANTGTNKSSLKATFNPLAVTESHIDSLELDNDATFELGANLNQSGALIHSNDAQIIIPDGVTHLFRGAVVVLNGSGEVTGDSLGHGALNFVGGNKTVTLTPDGTAHPTIDVDVDINLDGTTNTFDLSTTVNDSDLVLFGTTASITKGTVNLQAAGTAPGTSPGDLRIYSENFTLGKEATVNGNGTLYLNIDGGVGASPDSTKMMATIESDGTFTPSLQNVTIQDNVDLINPNGQLDVTGLFRHENGNLDFGNIDIRINGGQFVRQNGTYTADTGYLWLDTPTTFDQGTSDFTLPNLRLQDTGGISAVGTAGFTISDTLWLQLAAGQIFSHSQNLTMGDGSTIKYSGGTVDLEPIFAGKVNFWTINTVNATLPAKLFPASLAGMVPEFRVGSKNVTPAADLTLPGDCTLEPGGLLTLENGTLIVPPGATLELIDGTTKVISGDIDATAMNTTLSWGAGNSVEYWNDGAPRGTADELPGTVHNLTFRHYANTANAATTLQSPVHVTGTLNILNDLTVPVTSPLTVEGDINIESEASIFTNATDPQCTFNAPLEFTGPNDQLVNITTGTPDQIINLSLNAELKLNKDDANGQVTLQGGNLQVGPMTFVKGMFDTGDDNYLILPAPSPNQFAALGAQGFYGASDESHVIGNVAKMFNNSGVVNTSTNERSEFPVGNGVKYRPMALTFQTSLSGYPTVPNNGIIYVSHVPENPQGRNISSPATSAGVKEVSPFYWNVRSEPTLSQKVFDVELKANGFGDFVDVDELFIVRRHGDKTEEQNEWLLQGSTSEYDNALYSEGPAIISQNSTGGLRDEGALFALGLPEMSTTPSMFTPIWSGNPQNPMTLYITQAEFYDGAALAKGDEIGVFANGQCVGAGKVLSTPELTNPLIITCDDNGNAAINETTPLSFQIWDMSNGGMTMLADGTFYQASDNTLVPANPGFEANASYRVDVIGSATKTQSITLQQGWNIFSLAVDPPGDPNILLNAAGNNGILVPVVGELNKVQADNGDAIFNIFGNWQIGINSWDKGKAYYIKMDNDVTLNVDGQLLSSPQLIQLQTGWNLVPYPNFWEEKDVAAAFQSLIDDGYLEKIQDEQGRPFEYLGFMGSWVNNIGNMKPGEGYYVKVNTNCQISLETTNTLAKGSNVKTIAAEKAAEPEHFVSERGNPYKPMNVYITDANINGMPLRTGDEVAVYDGNRLVGAAVVGESISDDNPLILALAKDDGSDNGFVDGNPMTFKIWHKSSKVEVTVEPQHISYQDVKQGRVSGSVGFAEHGSAMVSLAAETDQQIAPTSFELKQNYPNPFNPTTTISYSLPKASAVTVDIYDLTGKRVTTLVQGQQSAGVHSIEWNGTNSQGNLVASGVYLYRLSTNAYTETKKMIFTK